MWDPNNNILGTEEKNRMECAHITNGGRSLSKGGTWRNPCREEKPRTANGRMERRTGVYRSPAYKKRRRIRPGWQTVRSQNACTKRVHYVRLMGPHSKETEVQLLWPNFMIKTKRGSSYDSGCGSSNRPVSGLILTQIWLRSSSMRAERGSTEHTTSHPR